MPAPGDGLVWMWWALCRDPDCGWYAKRMEMIPVLGYNIRVWILDLGRTLVIKFFIVQIKGLSVREFRSLV